MGLDVHKKTTDVAIASDRSNVKVRSYGKNASTLDALNKLLKKLQDGDKELRFVYEAGPCGYQIYRYLDAKGIYCSVVAPSMIPRRSGDWIKTDRRDAINLVRLFRAGELTSSITSMVIKRHQSQMTLPFKIYEMHTSCFE
jgi:transposase